MSLHNEEIPAQKLLQDFHRHDFKHMLGLDKLKFIASTTKIKYRHTKRKCKNGRQKKLHSVAK